MKRSLLYFIPFCTCIVSFGKQTHEENLISLSKSSGLSDSVSNYIEVIKGLTSSNPDSSLIYADRLEDFVSLRNFKIESGEKSRLYFFTGLANYNKNNYSKTRYLIEKSLNLGHIDTLEGHRYFSIRMLVWHLI